jgi:hypothetical protein
VGSKMGRKLPTIRAGLQRVSLLRCVAPVHLHIVHVALDSERKAALDFGIFRVGIGVLERTTSQDCLLGVIECNGAKFFPV